MLEKMGILRRLISRSRAAGDLRCLSSVCGRESATELVGCSQGWEALFNKRHNDLYLSDPLSRRRIKLPPIDTLPDPDFNLDLEGHGSVSKVVLSSSPDDEECRAMMTFGPANRVAFCLPGRSSEWTPIGEPFFYHQVKDPFQRYARVHEDLVYCTKRKVFTSITACHIHLPGFLDERRRSFSLHDDDGEFDDNFPLERWDWDIRDPDSPKLVSSFDLYGSKYDKEKMDDEKWKKSRTRLWVEENIELLENECVQIPHLVYADHSDQLFLVVRFVRLMSGDGASPLGFLPSCEVKGLSGLFPGKTCGFVVVEITEERDRSSYNQHICKMEDDLNGMALFVGSGSGSAISASSHQFSPNSIYFTDARRIPRLCGANDTGVFNYATKTITTTTGRNSRIFRSASSNCSLPYRGLVDANQTITSSSIFRSAISNYSTAAPWLMLESQYTDSEGGWTYRFHSCAEAKTYSFLINRRGECFRPNFLGGNVVGSSQGWVALHYVWHGINALYLSDPTTFREIDLPPVEATARIRSLILDRGRDGNAFLISKSGLAFCSPGRSREWTTLGGGADYESLVYSSHHRRLFSLTSAFDLEAWDVESEQPRLERMIHFDMPDLRGQRPELARAMYLVCAEDSGELFVVVRFARVGLERDVRVLPTVDFEVYKMDRERERVVKMEDSLEGMTMFVGTNQPVAVRDVRGFTPNSIYFTYDKRGCYEKYNGVDVGIFDYQKRLIHPFSISINHPLNKALWFTPAI